MADETMIERMARAIHSSFGYGGKWPEPGCAQCMETARAALAAHLSHLKDSGMVIVPVEPTEAMLSYGAASFDSPSVYMGGPSQNGRRKADRIYRAMISALSPPEQET